ADHRQGAARAARRRRRRWAGRRLGGATEVSVLPVPYISQVDEGRPINDCGPACALMVARAYGKALDTSIDDLYARYRWPDDALAVFTITQLLSSLGVPCHRAIGSLAQLR